MSDTETAAGENKTGIGSGDVPIKLGDEELILKPTWLAAKTISGTAGGILGSIEKVLRVDVEEISRVVLIGLGYIGNRKPPADLMDKIWKTGYTTDGGALVERCVTYLRVLSNGGRPVEPIDAADIQNAAKANPTNE
jgi:hypothetical protein